MFWYLSLLLEFWESSRVTCIAGLFGQAKDASPEMWAVDKFLIWHLDVICLVKIDYKVFLRIFRFKLYITIYKCYMTIWRQYVYYLKTGHEAQICFRWLKICFLLHYRKVGLGWWQVINICLWKKRKAYPIAPSWIDFPPHLTLGCRTFVYFYDLEHEEEI